MKARNLVSLFPVIDILIMARVDIINAFIWLPFFLSLTKRNEITFVIYMEKSFLQTFLIVNIFEVRFLLFFS